MRFRIGSPVLYWADEEPIRKIFHVLLDHKNVEVTTLKLSGQIFVF